MHTELIYVIGAGGHGKVVLDALLASEMPASRIRVRDDALVFVGRTLLGHPIQTPAADATMSGHLFHLAVGDGAARRRLFAELIALGARPVTLTHPGALVSPFATLDGGAFIAARAIVAPDARVGQGVIVNHGAVVDHDCMVDDFSHIAPNATLGGGVKIGKGVLVGAGANVLPGISVSDGAVIGAGAVVTQDVAAGEVYVGIPARALKGS